MELASSASVAFVVTGESIGGRKLYSVGDCAPARFPPILPAARVRARGELREPAPWVLVRLSRRPAVGRNGAARAALRRSAGACPAGVGQAAVARRPRLARRRAATVPFSRPAKGRAMLGGGAAEGRQGAARHVLGGPANAVQR